MSIKYFVNLSTIYTMNQQLWISPINQQLDIHFSINAIFQHVNLYFLDLISSLKQLKRDTRIDENRYNYSFVCFILFIRSYFTTQILVQRYSQLKSLLKLLPIECNHITKIPKTPNMYVTCLVYENVPLQLYQLQSTYWCKCVFQAETAGYGFNPGEVCPLIYHLLITCMLYHIHMYITQQQSKIQ